MAERRMFSKTIIDSDLFLDMPLSAQALYFHLAMRADDDGFLNCPRKIQRALGCSDDDLKLLIVKRFCIVFDSGILVIRHWLIHNRIQKDRYKETAYVEEKTTLRLDERKAYIEAESSEKTVRYPTCIQNGDSMDTNCVHSIGKESVVKNSINTISSAKADAKPREKDDYQQIIDNFNRICVSLPKVQSVNDRRKKAIRSASQTVEDFGGWEKLFQAIERSDFLTGRNGVWNGCGFDWILKLGNLTKIIEGNYANGGKARPSRSPDFSDPANYNEHEDVDYDTVFGN